MATRIMGDSLFTQTNLAKTYSYDLNLDAVDFVSLQAVYTDATPAAKTFVDANVTVAADTVTITAHGYTTGLKGQLTTTGTLPAGLATSTNYWLVVVNANTIGFATSLANAVAGTKIDITAAAGGGTHTFTATALSTTGNVVKLQASNDSVNFADISGDTVTITAGGNTVWDLGRPGYRVVRILSTPSTGSITLTVAINAKGDK